MTGAAVPQSSPSSQSSPFIVLDSLERSRLPAIVIQILVSEGSSLCLLAGYAGKGWSLRLQGFVSDAASQGFPCELMMKGPARFTALAKPCSFLSLTSQSRWTFANASGAFPL